MIKIVKIAAYFFKKSDFFWNRSVKYNKKDNPKYANECSSLSFTPTDGTDCEGNEVKVNNNIQ